MIRYLGIWGLVVVGLLGCESAFEADDYEAERAEYCAGDVEKCEEIEVSSLAGSSSDEGVSYGELVDVRDGRSYRTVMIGDQRWMAENLNYGSYIQDNTLESQVQEGWEKFCYGNQVINCDSVGGLYQWHTVMAFDKSCANGQRSCSDQIYSGNHEGICPVGWHVPKQKEWSLMEEKLSVVKSVFPIAGMGHRFANGDFSKENSKTYFWRVEEYEGRKDIALTSFLYNDLGYFSQGNSLKTAGYSVRCIEGEGVTPKSTIDSVFVNSQECGYDSVLNTLSCKEATYKTVTIGNQVWMGENLNFGEFIQSDLSSNHYQNKKQKFCYDNNVSNCELEGGLYQWHSVVDVPKECGSYDENCDDQIENSNHQGICPMHWHIPNTSEWNVLIENLGGPESGGKKVKALEFGGNDSLGVGLSILGAGRRDSTGGFVSRGLTTGFWTPQRSQFIFIYNNEANLSSGATAQEVGFSVRCLKD